MHGNAYGCILVEEEFLSVRLLRPGPVQCDDAASFRQTVRPVLVLLAVFLRSAVIFLTDLLLLPLTPLALPSVTAIPDQLTGTGFAAGIPDPTHLARLWRQPLDGAVYTESLVVDGEVIVATERDSLYALDVHN